MFYPVIALLVSILIAVAFIVSLFSVDINITSVYWFIILSILILLIVDLLKSSVKGLVFKVIIGILIAVLSYILWNLPI